MGRRKWTDEEKAEASRKAKERANKKAFLTAAENSEEVATPQDVPLYNHVQDQNKLLRDFMENNDIPIPDPVEAVVRESTDQVQVEIDQYMALKAENERLRAEIARNQLGMTVQREELPPTPKQFLDDENWHYYLCIQSKGDEEDELADKLSRDPLKGGYEIAPGGKISSRKTWLRIPQTLFKSRKQAAVDEARARWQRPEGQDVRDGLIQKREQSEQYVGAGLPAGVA